VDDILLHLDADTIERACEHIGAYLDIRGYGPVKDESVRKMREHHQDWRTER
jgi:hypothetical protein